MTTAKHAVERVHPPDLLMKAVNPLMRALAKRAAAVQNFVLVLHYQGRRTGRHFDLPVGYRLVDGRILLFSNSTWRHNFRGGREIEVTYRGQRQTAKATLISDAQVVADVYERLYAELDKARVRRELGVRVNVDRAPTREEWLNVIERAGMAIVEVTLRDGDVANPHS
ncbi:MAG: nitroreductase/quinone reductase family protein [Acidimicrobiia bacterium]